MKSIITTCLLVCTCVLLQAQDLVFVTLPAAKKVGVLDPFEVQYVIKNGRNVQDFQLPPMKDFQVLDGPSQNVRYTFINGERSMNIELTYVLRARKTGNLTIPGGIAIVEGHQIHSNNASIEVINGSVIDRKARRRSADPYFDDPFADLFEGGDPFAAMQKQHQQIMQMMQQQMQQQAPMKRRMVPQSQPQQGPELISKKDIANNIFIKVDVDKKNVSLGDQIIVSYKLYTRLPMEVNLTKLPMLNGFWSQDFNIPNPPKPVREIYNGKEFQVFEIKRTALFPTQTGNLVLDAAEGAGKVRILNAKKVKQQDPFSQDEFLNNFFGSMMMNDPDFDNQFMTTYDYEDVPVKLKSAPIQITVNDIPAEKRPSAYKGAVGTYTIESNIDKTELTTDDVATITLKVAGTGNLKLIGAPDIKFPEDLDSYDPVMNDTITNTNDIIAGYKSFSYAFAPRVPGTFSIPATEFSYYDPHSKEFKTISTPSYTVHVKPGKNDKQSAQNQLPKDIHDINATTAKIEKSKQITLPINGLYWSGFALPFLAYIGLFVYRKKENELESNSTLFKNKRANKIAMKRLATAEKYLKQSNQRAFYEEASKAVWLYLSDKLTISLALLSKEVASQKMNEKNVSNALQSELFRIADECEMALYSPDRGTMKMHQTFADALKLIGKLEDELA